MIDRGELAEALGHSTHLDDWFTVFHLDLNSHVHRLTRMQIGRSLRIEDRFDHEDEFRPALAAVDDRRRVFRARRDVAHFSQERIFHAIHGYLRRVPIVNRADARFRNERAHLDVLRRQKHNHRFSCGNPLTLTKQRFVNQTCLRRRLSFLLETPVCLSKSPLVLISCRAGAIQILSRSHACAEKFFLSRELRFRKHERRFDLLARCLFRGFIQSE